MPASGSALTCALLALSPAVADGGSGTMTVSGATVETVHYAATDVLHELRTSLAHREGAAGPSSTVDRFEAGTGKCYVIDGRITVSSNVAHDVLVSGDSTHPGLRFLSERPVEYEGCAGGEAVSGTMFATSGSPGGWVHDQQPSAQRVHVFAVALIVDHGAEPLEIVADALLRVEARPAAVRWSWPSASASAGARAQRLEAPIACVVVERQARIGAVRTLRVQGGVAKWEGG